MECKVQMKEEIWSTLKSKMTDDVGSKGGSLSQKKIIKEAILQILPLENIIIEWRKLGFHLGAWKVNHSQWKKVGPQHTQ